jgi:hypothetical protein
VTDPPLDDGLSKVVRRQLQDLCIDPDATLPPRRRGAVQRLKAWCVEHKHPLVILSGVASVFVFLLSVLILLALVASGPTGTAARSATPSVAVTLGDATIQIGPPAYRRFSLTEGSLLLHLYVRNTAATQARLLAGDLFLVDARGALFPPSWHNIDGNTVDGASDPKHGLVALDPGADAEIDLHFLVLTEGPFTLRYQRDGGLADAELPLLTLTKGS